MSILLNTLEGWIISHSNYLNEIYKTVKNSETYCTLKFDEKFFSINSQFLRDNQFFKSANGILSEDRKSKKRKRSANLLQRNSEEINRVKDTYRRIKSCAEAEAVFTLSNVYDNNEAARTASNDYYSKSSSLRSSNFCGANESETPIVAEIDNDRFVFPEKCSFYAYDVKDLAGKLSLDRQYDFILMDPPWWNKFVRRRKEKSSECGYTMMYNEDFAKIPIKGLLSAEGIIAVWCTNAPSHLHSITNEMFPSWGVTYLAKWYWLKVTQSGNPICDFNTTGGKQPFELLIFGKRSVGEDTNFPDGKLIVSVPSCVHSHKPPIAEILIPYLKESPKCLEIFARYLLPNWTSWGLEVLKFQNLSFYDIVERDDNFSIKK